MKLIAANGSTVNVEPPTAVAMATGGSRYQYGTLGVETPAAQTMNVDAALGVSAVYACTSLVAKIVGTLPLQTFEQQDDGHPPMRVETDTSRMLEYRPNPDMAASTVWSTICTHLLLRGNAYLAKQKNERGMVTALYPLHPDRVVPWRDENGKKWLQVTHPTSGAVAHYDARHVLHIVGLSFGTGLAGHSVVSVMRRRLEAQLAQTRHQQKMMEQGLTARGVLKVPYELDAEGEGTAKLRTDIRTFYSGAENAGSVMVLETGMDFEPITITASDAQFLEQMKHSATEVASWFSLPAAEIGAEGATLTYQTAVHNDLQLLKKGVRFWLRRIQDDLFTDPDLFNMGRRFVRFNVDALLEVDAKTRMDVHRAGYELGVHTPRRIAGLEGFDPVEGAASDLTGPAMKLALVGANRDKKGDA